MNVGCFRFFLSSLLIVEIGDCRLFSVGMAAITVLPYRIRYANGRDICIKCGTQIPKGQIQLAIIEQVT